MPRLLVDANIFLELMLGQSRSKECKEFLSNVAKGKIKAATTDFVIDSVGVIMEDRGSSAGSIRRFFASLLLYKGLVIHNLDLQGRILAASAMESEGLNFDDATSFAAMRRLGISEIISFDRHFDKVRGITRIEPKTALARI